MRSHTHTLVSKLRGRKERAGAQSTSHRAVLESSGSVGQHTPVEGGGARAAGAKHLRAAVGPRG